MRIVGLDVGEKRIGVAMSDELLITAQPLQTIERKNIEEDIRAINGVLSTYGAKEVVVGLPISLDGTEGKSARSIIDFIELLKKGLHEGVVVKTWDERLTSVQAERILLEADISRRKRKSVIDRLSAQLILQGYLNSKPYGVRDA